MMIKACQTVKAVLAKHLSSQTRIFAISRVSHPTSIPPSLSSLPQKEIDFGAFYATLLTSPLPHHYRFSKEEEEGGREAGSG